MSSPRSSAADRDCQCILVHFGNISRCHVNSLIEQNHTDQVIKAFEIVDVAGSEEELICEQAALDDTPQEGSRRELQSLKLKELRQRIKRTKLSVARTMSFASSNAQRTDQASGSKAREPKNS